MIKTKNPIIEEGKSLHVENGSLNAGLVLCSLCASIPSLLFGANILLNDTKTHVHCDKPESALFPVCYNLGFLWQAVATTWCIGGLVGALSCGALTSKYGRKKVIIFNNLFFVIGSLIMSFSMNIPMLFVGRFLMGIGCGLSTGVVPMYLSEISPDSVRGIITSLHQGAIVLGILIFSLLKYFVITEGTNGWRFLFALVGLIAVVHSAVMAFLPESPTFLAKMGMSGNLENALRRLRGTFDVRDELSRFSSRESQSFSDSRPMTILELLSSRVARKSVIVTSVFQAAQQFCGINAYFYYGTTIFDGVAGIIVYLAVANMVFTVISILLIGRLGRKPLMLISSFICALATGLMLLGFMMDSGSQISRILKGSGVVTFVGGFAIGLGPIPWVILGDVFPSNAINAGVTIAVSLNWIFTAIVSLVYSELIKRIPVPAFIMFLGIIAGFFAFELVFVKETAGKADFL